MNSKEDSEKNQDNLVAQVEEGRETIDNGLLEPEIKPCKVAKIQNKISNEHFRLNNNIGDGNARCISLSRTSVMLSNGSQIIQTNVSDIYSNSSDINVSQDTLNTNTASSLVNTSCSKSLTSNVNPSQLKHKISVHANSSTNANAFQTYSSVTSIQPDTSVDHSTASVSATCSGVSTSVTNEDADIRNNVDYVSEIEKCPPKVSCSSGSSLDVDSMWASRSYASKCVLNNIKSSIGSTSQGTCCFLRPNINGSREAAGPSGLQKISQGEHERRDSSSGNEGDMSDGEDCCIYTYKGHDEPVHLDPNQGQAEDHEAEEHHSGRSSPEMDFLEMDFDPGPSCEQDTGDSDLASINEDIQNIAMDNMETDPVLLNDLSSGRVVAKQEDIPTSQQIKQSAKNVSHEVNHVCNDMQSNINQVPSQVHSSPWMPSTSSGIRRWEATGLHRSIGCPLRESYGHHNTNGDLISPGDNRDVDTELWADSSTVSTSENSNLNSRKVNLSSTLYHRMMAKKLMLNKQAPFNQSGDSNLENELCNERLESLSPVEKVMLWNEQEATVKQVTQIATSACGATAAINALLALDVAFSLEVLVRGVATKLREPGTPLPRYLMSRSLAGSTHKDLARGISLATSGAVITKFFAFYPERKVSLSHWLHYWISKGAAPIATLNLQHCGEGCDIPDAWHHQMIFGVGPAGIYLTNPVQCLPEQIVWHQLVSPSVLLIRRADVLAHWNSVTDLTPLTMLDQNWRKFNVLGQVVNMVREAMGQRQQPPVMTTSTTHIRIPASYRAGITLVMCSDAVAATELLHAEQLPLL